MTEITITGQVAVALVLAFLGLLFAFGKVLLSQIQKNLDERAIHQKTNLDERAANQKLLLEKLEERINDRFTAQDQSRDARMRSMEDKQTAENLRINNLTNEVHALTNLLPLRYVQRDDWIRFASQIDHKIDRLGELFTTVTMRLPK